MALILPGIILPHTPSVGRLESWLCHLIFSSGKPAVELLFHARVSMCIQIGSVLKPVVLVLSYSADFYTDTVTLSAFLHLFMS